MISKIMLYIPDIPESWLEDLDAETDYCRYAGECTIGCHQCKYFEQKGSRECRYFEPKDGAE